MTSLWLKIIAVTSMIVDHIGAVFFPYYMVHIFGVTLYPLRTIGRLAFPIYCFLLIEGICHTSNWKRYAIRLGVLAFISELPFDLALFGRVTWQHQNVFFTLLFGLLAAQVDLICKKKGNYIGGYIAFLAACFAAQIAKTDYGAIGIVLIMMCYYWRKQLVLLALGILGIGFYVGMSQPFGVFAIVPIYFYNGKQGYQNKEIQLLWYLIYPIHLTVIAMIALYGLR